MGNAYQHELEATIANQDFGNDACINVGYDDKSTTQPRKNWVIMKDLHPHEDEVWDKIIHGLFPPNSITLTQLIESPDFQQLLATDATTKDGQQKVAEYFHVSEEWAAMKETTVFRYIMSYCVS